MQFYIILHNYYFDPYICVRENVNIELCILPPNPCFTQSKIEKAINGSFIFLNTQSKIEKAINGSFIFLNKDYYQALCRQKLRNLTI